MAICQLRGEEASGAVQELFSVGAAHVGVVKVGGEGTA